MYLLYLAPNKSTLFQGYSYFSRLTVFALIFCGFTAEWFHYRCWELLFVCVCRSLQAAEEREKHMPLSAGLCRVFLTALLRVIKLLRKHITALPSLMYIRIELHTHVWDRKLRRCKQAESNKGEMGADCWKQRSGWCLFMRSRHADTGRHSGRMSEAFGIRRGSLEGNTKVYKAVRLYAVTLNRPACAWARAEMLI